ncbi:MAG: hypothetical protein V5A43_10235 [Haloarculaceae archaeon]
MIDNGANTATEVATEIDRVDDGQPRAGRPLDRLRMLVQDPGGTGEGE